MTTLALCALLAATPVRAADAEPVVRPLAANEPAPRGSVAGLQEEFVSSLKPAARSKALEALGKTPPTTARDITALFDLFMRYPDPNIRGTAMASLALIPKDSPQLEPLFLTYLKQPEPEAQLFGINGSFRLRVKSALPLIRALAQKRFSAASAAETSVMSERNAWWTQYEALSVLAQWEGEKALPLIEERLKESPQIGRILGRFYWKRTLPKLAGWSLDADLETRERARQAVSAPIEPEEARATRAEMLALVRDARLDEELRHQLALKAGFVSTEAETEALIKEHDAAADERTKLLLAAAVFVSRRDAAVPLLVRYAKESEDASMRQGAYAQLADMLGEDAAKAKVPPKK